MKLMTMLVAATAAMLAANVSTARSQEACSKEYGVCVDHCATKVARAQQDACIEACQGKNNRCSEKVFGSRREVGPAGEPAADGDKAMAKEAAPPPRKVDIAPRKTETPAVRKVDVPPRKKAEVPASPVQGSAQDKAPDKAPAMPAVQDQAPAADAPRR